MCEQFLEVSIDYLGTIPFDHDLRDAVQKQNPVTVSHPNSMSAKAFKEIAYSVDSWPIPQGMTGYLQFFVENLFQSGH